MWPSNNFSDLEENKIKICLRSTLRCNTDFYTLLFLLTPISAPLVMFVCLFMKDCQVGGINQGIWTLTTSILDLAVPLPSCVTPSQTGR